MHQDKITSAAVRAAGLIGAAGVAAAIAAFATPASAAAIFLDKAAIYNPGTAYISGPGYAQEYVYAGPVLFTANYGTSASSDTFEFLGFCVDIFDSISVGINSPATINLAYHDGDLVDNGWHAPYPAADYVSLSQTQKDQVSALVNYGTSIWNNDALTDPTHNLSNSVINTLAGIQGAIWKIENPTFTITGAPTQSGWGDQAQITANINTFSSTAFLNTLPTGKIDVVFSSDTPLHQAFALAVPEPSTWAMMIIGFGAMGAVLRRRRVLVAHA